MSLIRRRTVLSTLALPILLVAACSFVNAPEATVGVAGAGGAGLEGGAGGTGDGGTGPACTVASECPGSDTTCRQRTCEGGLCGYDYAAAGVECSEPPGAILCDGVGSCVECVGPGDCATGNCADGVCVAASCTNGLLDGLETDVDCGGAECPSCELGDDCLEDADCESDLCPAGFCTVTSFAQAVTITSAAADALVDVQVPIDLGLGDIEFYSLKPNGDDLRFSSDGVQFDLPYWIETWSADASRIWVRVPLLPAATDTVIWMLYGSASLDAASDSDATFLFFDDFEDGNYMDKWDVHGSPATLEQAGGELHLVGAGNWEYVSAKASFTEAITTYADVRFLGSPGIACGLVWADSATDVRYTFRGTDPAGITGLVVDTDVSGSNLFEDAAYPGVPWTQPQGHRLEASARLDGGQGRIESLGYCNATQCNATPRTLLQAGFTAITPGLTSQSAQLGDAYVSLFFVTHFVPKDALTIAID